MPIHKLMRLGNTVYFKECRSGSKPLATLVWFDRNRNWTSILSYQKRFSWDRLIKWLVDTKNIFKPGALNQVAMGKFDFNKWTMQRRFSQKYAENKEKVQYDVRKV